MKKVVLKSLRSGFNRRRGFYGHGGTDNTEHILTRCPDCAGSRYLISRSSSGCHCAGCIFGVLNTRRTCLAFLGIASRTLSGAQVHFRQRRNARVTGNMLPNHGNLGFCPKITNYITPIRKILISLIKSIVLLLY